MNYPEKIKIEKNKWDAKKISTQSHTVIGNKYIWNFVTLIFLNMYFIKKSNQGNQAFSRNQKNPGTKTRHGKQTITTKYIK